MVLLINVHMEDGSVVRDIFLDTMKEAEEFVSGLDREKVPYKKVVVYEKDTGEALRIFHG